MSNTSNIEHSSIKIPKEVWNQITHYTSSDKVYVLTGDNGRCATEVGVYANKEDAYNVAFNILGNYMIGTCIIAGYDETLKKFYSNLYQQQNSVNLKHKTYESRYETISDLASRTGINKLNFKIEEKHVETLENCNIGGNN